MYSSLLEGLFLISVVAYLDPGTGSVILQVLVGGVAAVAISARMWWSRVTSVFRRKPRKDVGEHDGP